MELYINVTLWTGLWPYWQWNKRELTKVFFSDLKQLEHCLGTDLCMKCFVIVQVKEIDKNLYFPLIAIFYEILRKAILVYFKENVSKSPSKVLMVWICRLADCKVFEREEAETVWRPLEFVVILNTELKASWCLQETAGNHRADTDLQRGRRTGSTGKKFLEKEYRQVRGIKAIKIGSWQMKPATSLGDAGLVEWWWSKAYTEITIRHMVSGSMRTFNSLSK